MITTNTPLQNPLLRALNNGFEEGEKIQKIHSKYTSEKIVATKKEYLRIHQLHVYKACDKNTSSRNSLWKSLC